MKRLLTLVSGLALVAALATAATADVYAATKAPGKATIVIRHQVSGCHTWSLNGGAYRATLTAHLARGGTIRFVDNDMMPHQLIQKAGPAVRFLGRATMGHMSASVTVSFPKAGVYHFGTKAGEDYTPMKTIGEDNALRLTVKVS
jgi:plastocyanin